MFHLTSQLQKSNLLKSTLASLFLISYANHALAEDANTWVKKGEAALAAAKKLKPNNKRAKNVILFVGDGMGISTITAARIFEGQTKGIDGEGNQLAFEKLPYVALSKTYSANQQTADSAPTMTAIVTGVKTNDGILSLNQSAVGDEEDNAKVLAAKLVTILELAEKHGLSTGVVSTARLTHATPAATYAHTSSRDWEDNHQVPVGSQVKDIAAQLIDNFAEKPSGNGLEVALGGGRTNFLPNTLNDPEYPSITGRRTDGRNLVEEFKQKFNAQYVWNSVQFKAIDPKKTQRLLGLFEPSHMQYEYDRGKDMAGEPSLTDMTDKAIDILAQNKKGYFLMVEAGRIDHAHHAGNAYRALSDTVELSNAVKRALEKVDLENTLVIVTADHSHTFTIAGYPARGNPILGKVVNPGTADFAKASDGNPYTTLSYGNGAGFHEDHTIENKIDPEPPLMPRSGRVKDLTSIDTTNPNYHQEATVPLKSETHGAEDVAVFSGGPKAHLLQGVYEQSYIFYVMKDALGL